MKRSETERNDSDTDCNRSAYGGEFTEGKSAPAWGNLIFIVFFAINVACVNNKVLDDKDEQTVLIDDTCESFSSDIWDILEDSKNWGTKLGPNKAYDKLIMSFHIENSDTVIYVMNSFDFVVIPEGIIDSYKFIGYTNNHEYQIQVLDMVGVEGLFYVQECFDKSYDFQSSEYSFTWIGYKGKGRIENKEIGEFKLIE